MFSGAAHAQIATSVVAMTPLLGLRPFPSYSIAEQSLAIESHLRCSLPGAPAGCEYLARMVQYGVAVHVKSATPVRGFEVTVRYIGEDQKEATVTEYVAYSGETTTKHLFLGKVNVIDAVAVPVQIAGPTLYLKK